MILEDPWCTTPGLDAVVETQVSIFRNADVRAFQIQEEDVTGWVAYPPGTEAASISFEYRLNETEWRTAQVFIAVVNGGICDTRFSID
jgi:hypothetical protein